MAKVKTEKNVPKKSKLQKRKDDHNSRLWRNKADRQWREAVVLLWGGKCAVCGCNGGQAHHLIPRQMGSHRHEPLNGILLCSSHHKFSFELSPHKAPVAFFKWLIDNHPDAWEWVSIQAPSRRDGITMKERYERLQRWRLCHSGKLDILLSDDPTISAKLDEYCRDIYRGANHGVRNLRTQESGNRDKPTNRAEGDPEECPTDLSGSGSILQVEATTSETTTGGDTAAEAQSCQGDFAPGLSNLRVGTKAGDAENEQ